MASSQNMHALMQRKQRNYLMKSHLRQLRRWPVQGVQSSVVWFSQNLRKENGSLLSEAVAASATWVCNSQKRLAQCD